MRIALTGATGMLGAALLRELAARGHQVHALARPRPGRTLADRPGVTWLSGDLDDATALDRLVDNTDAILHAAYWPLDEAPPPGRSLGEHFVQSNVVGTLRLVERTPRTRARQLVYVSSLAVYGNTPGAVPGATRRLDESSEVWPHEFYGAHKAALEKMVIAGSGASGMNTCAFRIGCLLARTRDATRDHVAPIAREGVLYGEIRSRVGAYVLSVQDAAAILVGALGDPSVAGKVYNTFHRWLDFSELQRPLSAACGRAIRVVAAPAPEPVPGLGNARLAERRPAWHTDEHVAALLQEIVRDAR